jgi:hypothetical protein
MRGTVESVKDSRNLFIQFSGSIVSFHWYVLHPQLSLKKLENHLEAEFMNGSSSHLTYGQNKPLLYKNELPATRIGVLLSFEV